MMETLLRVLFLFSALAAPGHSLSCFQCNGKDSTCKGTSNRCSNTQTCGLFYEEKTEGGTTSRLYIKKCVETEQCNKEGSISYLGGTVKVGISCCFTDNCTPSLPKFSTNSLKANGLTCPTCSSTENTYCSPRTKIKCTGNEQMCITEDGSINYDTEFAIVGCASQSVCEIEKLYYYNNSHDRIHMNFKCDSKPSTGNDVTLSCFQCAKTNSNCKGFKVTCPPLHSCGLTYREMNEDGKVSKEYINSCVPTQQCNTGGSITHALGKMKIGISCCDTNYCTPPLPQWSADSSDANGLSCQTCRSFNSITCESEKEIKCTGNEKTCVYQSAEKPGYKESAIGCATQGVCDIGSFSYNNDPLFINMKFSCDSGALEQPTSTSMTCVFCTSKDSLECEGVIDICPPNHVCASSYRITSSPESRKYDLVRSCLPEDKCNIFGTLSLSGSKIATGTSCCKEDGCTPSIAEWKTTLTKPNSVKCKTCQSPESDTCESSADLVCRGEENQCVTYALTTNSEFDTAAFSYRGCGMKTLCTTSNYLMAVNNVEYEHRFTCEKENVIPSV